VKNITISVDEELWSRIREAAAQDRISMNAFIRSVLSRSVKTSKDSTGERVAAVAESAGPAPKSWTWNRTEIYEDAG
jgi:plasmid stability protein